MSAPIQQPPRLSEADSPTGRLLERAQAQTAEAPIGQRERAWRRLQAPPRSRARWLVPVGVAAAAALALVLWLGPHSPTATLALASGTVELEHQSAWAAVRAGTQLGDGVALRTGPSSRAGVRVGGGTALLLDGSRARFTLARRAAELRLEQGAVVSAAPGLRVAAGAAVVEGASTFVAQVAAAEVDVFVLEGTAVVRSPTGTTSVKAGGSWSTRRRPATPRAAAEEAALARSLSRVAAVEAPLELWGADGVPVSVDGVVLGAAPLSVLAAAGPHQVRVLYPEVPAALMTSPGAARVELPPPFTAATDEALRARRDTASPAEREALTYELARRLTAAGRHAEAVALYLELASGDGARADASLYEVGRLRLRFLGDPAAALAAFTEHQRRFPASALGPEVALSSIEARLKLSQLREALTAMDAFTARYPHSERLGDVHFLKAEVHQELGDCARALPLYLTLLDDGAHGDDALYFAAFCQRQLGRPAAAKRLLGRYLERFPEGRHATQARAALGHR